MPVAQPVTAQTLIPFEGVIDLRMRCDGSLVERLSYTDALAKLTVSNLEGIFSPSGALKCLRDAPQQPKRVVIEPRKVAEVYTSRSTAITQANLGVYKQEVRKVTGTYIAPDPYGNLVEHEDYQVIGHVYAHCALRGAGM
jgi:hypothetical protein